jgi:hypothetical protein
MNDVFYVFERAETTYAAFSLQVARRARALPECRGDVVALLASHGPDFVINRLHGTMTGTLTITDNNNGRTALRPSRFRAPAWQPSLSRQRPPPKPSPAVSWAGSFPL